MQYGEDFIPVAPSYFVEEVKEALQKNGFAKQTQ